MQRHLLVLAAALLLAIVTLGGTLAVSAVAARGHDRVVAVFAPGTSAAAMLGRVALADGRIVRHTVLPFALEVQGDRPGIAARLEAAGARLVLTRLPAHPLAVGGCSYRDPARYPPARAELRAGPL